MSTTNVYRFFPSKRAIEEAVVEEILDTIAKAAMDAASPGGLALRRLGAVLEAIAQVNEDLAATDDKLYQLMALAAREGWPVTLSHEDRIRGLVQLIIDTAQASGEIYRSSSIELSYCLLEAMAAYLSPSRRKLTGPRPSFNEMMGFCAAALGQALSRTKFSHLSGRAKPL